MTIGYGSVGVNDQLVPIPTLAAFHPLAFGPTYTGPAFWPRQGVYNVPPIMPSASMQASMPASAYGGTVGENGTYDAPTALGPQGSPWSLKHSPLLWALLFLVVGLAGLHFIHFKG
jgi:hypothetical protein